MKELFTDLLLFLIKRGKLTEADLYRSNEWGTLVLETDNEKFKITISKE